jgi:pyrophosphatase PpaX
MAVSTVTLQAHDARRSGEPPFTTIPSGMHVDATTDFAGRWAAGWRPGVWLFDFDGTLADSLELILGSLRHATAEVLGASPSDEVLLAGIGRPLIDQMRALDGVRAKRLHDVYLEHNLAGHDRLLRPVPGIDPLLRSLRTSGRRLGVVTSKRRETALQGLRLLNLDGFETLVGYEDTGEHKPGPAPVLAALERMRADAGDALYVGDSAWDVRCGRAAGVGTAAVLWGIASRAQLAAEGPDLIWEHPQEAIG